MLQNLGLVVLTIWLERATFQVYDVLYTGGMKVKVVYNEAIIVVFFLFYHGTDLSF